MTYLFDNNISPKLARMLQALDVDARPLRDEFPAGIKDPQFLPLLKGSGWTFVTLDKHIRSRPVEVAALKESGVMSLFIAPFFAKMEIWAQATWLIKNWPTIERFVSAAAPGTITLFQQRGGSRLTRI